MYKLTKEEKLSELMSFNSSSDFISKLEVDNVIVTSKDPITKKYTVEKINDKIHEVFSKHVKENSQKIKAKDLFNYTNELLLINTPDGFQKVGDLIKKSKRTCYKITTINNNEISCSYDHKIETSSGWAYTKDLVNNDSILTKDGWSDIKTIEKIKDSEVYDLEVLHSNHRYWGGSGISSHNSGKTFLLLNAIREAQKQGYTIIFYDSENAIDSELVDKFGIDPRKFRYEPVTTVQEFRTNITNLVNKLIEKKLSGYEIPKIFIALDSAGNLATNKEVDDAASGSDKADMTRAKVLKSIFRIIIGKLAIIKAPFVFTNHTYSCVVGETQVKMSDNSSKSIMDIVKGDFVQTIDGNKEVLNTFNYKARTYKLILDNGKVIECTDRHKFLINENWKDDNSWKKLSELNENDEIFLVE